MALFNPDGLDTVSHEGGQLAGFASPLLGRDKPPHPARLWKSSISF
jgi:hypothetical protein